MKRYFFAFLGFFLLVPVSTFAEAPSLFRVFGLKSDIINPDHTFMSIPVLITSILLKGVLPIVVIAVSLYSAYELFTAEGDESKMKRAWKSFTFSAIALVIVALAYAMVAIIPQIKL
jgi:Type IV secretion system pilin